MAMSITELERSLRALRLSGMSATLQARALQVASHEMDFIEAFSWLVQDELDRRRSRLLDRRYALSGLAERKDLKAFDWSYNPSLPKRDGARAGHAEVHRRARRRAAHRPARHRQEPHRQGARAARRATAATRSSTARRIS